jgi:hypothetical protein
MAVLGDSGCRDWDGFYRHLEGRGEGWYKHHNAWDCPTTHTTQNYLVCRISIVNDAFCKSKKLRLTKRRKVIHSTTCCWTKLERERKREQATVPPPLWMP